MRVKLIGTAALVGSLIAPAAAALPLFVKRPAIDRRRIEIGDWRLDLRRNRFADSLICRLRSRDGRSFYQGHAVAFRFRSRWDVTDAVYRIDGGPPRMWRDDQAELIRIGAPVDAGGMANPSAGIVWIPLTRLTDANSIAIQPRGDRRARVFHFRGMKGLYAVARERGCEPDSRFIR